MISNQNKINSLLTKVILSLTSFLLLFCFTSSFLIMGLDSRVILWHIIQLFSSESTWEVPKKGFLSINEQEQLTSKTSNTSHTPSDQPTHTARESQSTSCGTPVTYGPAPKGEAYSTWQTVERWVLLFQNVLLNLIISWLISKLYL